MFCPNCGAHQAEGKKFCTSCGTNLLLVSQALSGQAPVLPSVDEIHRRRDLSKGVKMTIIGGAFLAIQFFSFIFSLPFRGDGSPFGFFSFIALVMMAVGISRIVNARPVIAPRPQQPYFPTAARVPAINEQPAIEEPARTTSGLAARHPGPSVTEEETQHLPAPAYAPPRDQN